jgi:transposase InsO family protein
MGEGIPRGDRRIEAVRPVPSHVLSAAERALIIAVVNEPRFAETPPARIVPALADQGIYIASESSFHRVLRAHGQMHRRGRAHPPRTSRPPTTHIATCPGEVWCWDVTFLPARILGRWFYLYLILDLYSRKIVGFPDDPAGVRQRASLPRLGRAGSPAVALSEQVGKVGDRALQPIVQRDRRFPTQQLAGQRDVGAALGRVVLRQRPIDDLRLRAGQPHDPLGGIRGGLVATVHDELLAEVIEADAEPAREILQQAMLDAFVATLPGAPTNNVALAKIIRTWADLK